MSTTSDVDQSGHPTKPLILWLVPIVGAIAVPGLWWTRANEPFALRPQLVLTMTMFVAVFAVALLGGLSRGFRKRIRWAMGVTSVVVVAGFQWGVFVEIGAVVAVAVGLPILVDIVPVVVAGLLLWITTRLADELPFAVTMSVAMVIVVGTFGIASLSLIAPAPPDLDAATARPGSPDVLLLVLDGYARGDWLEEVYGYDNSPFLEELEARGFSIASEATPNYSYTYASLSTMLNLDYVFLPDDIEENERKRMRAALTGATGMVSVFRQGGYEIAYFENAWGGSLCGSAIDWCIRDGLLVRGFWDITQMSILAPLVDTILRNPFTSVSVGHLRSLGDVISTPNSDGRPRFTIAHVLLPHSPLLLDADCNLNPTNPLRSWGSGSDEAQATRRGNYIDQLECVNRLALDALDAFLTANPDGIVMVTADHGPASTLSIDLPADQQADVTIQERMKILSAYRIPGCESTFRLDLTPVNGTRLIVNCALGTDLAPLRDVNRWITLDYDGGLTELLLER